MPDRDDQTTMFGAQPVARRTDPETSHAAAKIAGRRLRESQMLVLDALAGGPMTDEEMQAALKAPMSLSGSRTRRKELTREGLVSDTGKTRRTTLGNPSIVWEVTQTGFALLREMGHAIDTTRLLDRCRRFWRGEILQRPAYMELVAGLAQEMAAAEAADETIAKLRERLDRIEAEINQGEEEPMTEMTPEMPTTHNHGNCELCDWIEARIEALERFHKALDIVEDGVLDFHLHHEAVMELREAHRVLHPAALAAKEKPCSK